MQMPPIHGLIATVAICIMEKEMPRCLNRSFRQIVVGRLLRWWTRNVLKTLGSLNDTEKLMRCWVEQREGQISVEWGRQFNNR